MNLPLEYTSDFQKIHGQLHCQTTIRVIRPKLSGHSSKLPVVIIFNCNWQKGTTFPGQYRLIEEFVEGSQIAVVYASQWYSPEIERSLAIEEAYLVAQWVAQNSELLNVDQGQIGVGANTSNSAIAIAVQSLAEERQWPPIKFQVLLGFLDGVS